MANLKDVEGDLARVRAGLRTLEEALPAVVSAASQALMAARCAQADGVLAPGPEASSRQAEAESHAKAAADREAAVRAEIVALTREEHALVARVAALTPPVVPFETLLLRRQDGLRKRLIAAVAELLVHEHHRGKKVGCADLSAIIPKFCGGSGPILGAMGRARAEICKEGVDHE
jgi:hypothetical protein